MIYELPLCVLIAILKQINSNFTYQMTFLDLINIFKDSLSMVEKLFYKKDKWRKKSLSSNKSHLLSIYSYIDPLKLSPRKESFTLLREHILHLLNKHQDKFMWLLTPSSDILSNNPSRKISEEKNSNKLLRESAKLRTVMHDFFESLNIKRLSNYMIKKSTFVKLWKVIYRVLSVQKNANNSVIERLWKYDSKGGSNIDFETFFRSMLELMECWMSTESEDDCATFIRLLHREVARRAQSKKGNTFIGFRESESDMTMKRQIYEMHHRIKEYNQTQLDEYIMNAAEQIGFVQLQSMSKPIINFEQNIEYNHDLQLESIQNNTLHSLNNNHKPQENLNINFKTKENLENRKYYKNSVLPFDPQISNQNKEKTHSFPNMQQELSSRSSYTPQRVSNSSRSSRKVLETRSSRRLIRNQSAPGGRSEILRQKNAQRIEQRNAQNEATLQELKRYNSLLSNHQTRAAIDFPYNSMIQRERKFKENSIEKQRTRIMLDNREIRQKLQNAKPRYMTDVLSKKLQKENTLESVIINQSRFSEHKPKSFQHLISYVDQGIVYQVDNSYN